jgi:hypothetical protein
MKCLVLIPCGEAPTPHSPDNRTRLSQGEEKARLSQGEEKAVLAGLGGYLAFEADDLKSAIKLAARIRTARVGPCAGAASRSGAGLTATKETPRATSTGR